MGKLDCVAHNLIHHLKSGLSCFIQDIYNLCEENRFSPIYIYLLSEEPLPRQLSGNREALECVMKAKLKFNQILMSSSGLKPLDIESVIILVDFHFGETITIDKQKEMYKNRASYEYDPIYDIEVNILTKSGIEKVNKITNK